MINQHDAKSITFENIQQTAEVVLLKLLEATGAAEQRQHAIVLESLKHMAELKSTIAWQSERKEAHELNKQQTEAMTSVAAKVPEPVEPGQCFSPAPTAIGKPEYPVCTLKYGHAGAHNDGSMRWTNASGGELFEPTKPAADRLHELVSYCQGSADACAAEAEAQRDVVGQESRKQPGDYEAAIFSELADKLQDILSEGGI